MIEADESDRSFLKLGRDVAVITNIELDHHSTYANLGELERAFAEFAEPARLRVLGPDVELGAAGDSVRIGIESGDLARRARGAAARRLALRGRGRARRAARARAATTSSTRSRRWPPAARRASSSPRPAPALADFSGAGRRFEEHGRTPGGALVYDDYAHHPTEVRATLEAARTLRTPSGGGWSPASSRTSTRARALLARDFGRALALADVVVVVDVYPARERAEDFPGVSGLLVAAGGRRRGRRPAGLVAAAASTRPSACWRPSWARATCW